MSIEQFYEKYGRPEEFPVTRSDGNPLTPNIAPKAVVPLYLGKQAESFELSEAHVQLSDFGEAFCPEKESETRLGEDCHTPLAWRPPEARFEPQSPPFYSADIWSLAGALWDLMGMKPVFSCDLATEDEVTSQQIEVLGPLPSPWWERWEERGQFFNEAGHPTEGREVWSPLPELFEEHVQKYRRKRCIGEFDKGRNSCYSWVVEANAQV